MAARVSPAPDRRRRAGGARRGAGRTPASGRECGYRAGAAGRERDGDHGPGRRYRAGRPRPAGADRPVPGGRDQGGFGLLGSAGNRYAPLMLKGFKEFIMRGNVIDLAVAVVIGTAFTAVV